MLELLNMKHINLTSKIDLLLMSCTKISLKIKGKNDLKGELTYLSTQMSIYYLVQRKTKEEIQTKYYNITEDRIHINIFTREISGEW